jgi:Uma2 family endonuclease
LCQNIVGVAAPRGNRALIGTSVGIEQNDIIKTAFGGGKLSPDVSWIEKSRLEGVNIVGFIPVIPDFVIELRSATDSLSETQSKMREYQRLGVRLGLLVNPQNKKVEIYRPGRELEILESPSSLVEDLPLAIDCNEVMPGFILSMDRIF